jgi:hypothetical protein
MENGNVIDFLKRYPVTYCVNLVSGSFRIPIDVIMQALDIALGLEHLHSLNPSIVHGDLKGVGLTCIPGPIIANLNVLTRPMSSSRIREELAWLILVLQQR